MGSLDRVSTDSCLITHSLPSGVRVAWLKSTPPVGTSICLPNLGREEGELWGSGEEENEFPENELFDGKLENEFKFEELDDEDEKTLEIDDEEDGEEKEDGAGENVGEEGAPIIVWKWEGDGETIVPDEEERSRMGRVGDWDPDTAAVSQTPNNVWEYKIYKHLSSRCNLWYNSLCWPPSLSSDTRGLWSDQSGRVFIPELQTSEEEGTRGVMCDVQTVQFALQACLHGYQGGLQVITHSSVPIINFVFVSLKSQSIISSLRSLRFNKFVTKYLKRCLWQMTGHKIFKKYEMLIHRNTKH